MARVIRSNIVENGLFVSRTRIRVANAGHYEKPAVCDAQALPAQRPIEPRIDGCTSRPAWNLHWYGWERAGHKA